MEGYLLVDKPAGWTSHDVVAKVRSILQQVYSGQLSVDSAGSKEPKTTNYELKTPSPKVKVGHTGTLDPAATGLMILVIGSYTKKAAEFSKLDKTYEAKLILGSISTTGDSEGEISIISRMRPKDSKIIDVVNSFKGEIQQVPPAYSAIKVGGQRAYKLARQGKLVKIEPRKVTIYGIKHVVYDYPKLKFTVSVSSGTYIRSLAVDIGDKLGIGAYLSGLRRISVNNFNVNDVISINNLTAENFMQNLQIDTGVAKVL